MLYAANNTFSSGAVKQFWPDIFTDTPVGLAHKGSSARIESGLPGVLKWCKLNSIGDDAWIQHIVYWVKATPGYYRLNVTKCLLCAYLICLCNDYRKCIHCLYICDNIMLLMLILRLYHTVLRKWQKKQSWFWKTCLQISDRDFCQTRQVSVVLFSFIVLCGFYSLQSADHTFLYSWWLWITHTVCQSQPIKCLLEFTFRGCVHADLLYGAVLEHWSTSVKCLELSI